MSKRILLLLLMMTSMCWSQVSQQEKLEQRKDDFIKMASHELKTPITSINGYVQLLLNIYNEAGTENSVQSSEIAN